jgi:HEAT repeat protein
VPRLAAALAALVFLQSAARAEANPAALDPAVRREVLRMLAGIGSSAPEAKIAAAKAAGISHLSLFVHPLRGLLSTADPRVRAAAVEALGELGVPRTTSDLFALVAGLERASQDSDDSVAKAAIGALSRYPFPEVRIFIAHYASDPKIAAPRRQAAAKALAEKVSGESRARLEAWLEVSRREAAGSAGNIHSKALPMSSMERFGLPNDQLLLAARDLLDPDVLLHKAAAETIAASVAPGSQRVPFLRRSLDEREPAIRRVAAEALAAHAEDAFLLALIPACRDPDRRVREIAIKGVAKKPTSEGAVIFVERLRDETDLLLRAQVNRALGEEPEDAVLSELSTWDGAVEDGPRSDAIDLVAARTSTRAAAVLVRLMVTAKEKNVAEKAGEKLILRGEGEAVPPLIEALAAIKAKGARRRIVALLALMKDPRITTELAHLAEMGDADDILFEALEAQADSRQPLLRLVGHASPSVRARALSAISDLSGEDVVSALVDCVKKHPDDDDAFQLLLHQDRGRLLDPLLDLLSSPDHRPRREAILASIRGHKDPRIAPAATIAALDSPSLAQAALEIVREQTESTAVPALHQLASDQRIVQSTRADALRAMAGYGSEHIFELVHPLALDQELEVRMAARNALHELNPEVYPKWDPYGRIPLVVEGAAFGAGMMLIASDIADARLSPAFTGAVGMVLGGATPFLLTLNEDVTLGDAGFFGTIALWGTLGGWGAGGSLHLSDQTTRWTTIGGEVLGLSIGGLMMRRAEWSLEESGLVNFSALEAGLASASIAALAASRSSSGGFLDLAYVGMLGGAVGAVPVALFAKKLELDKNLVTLSTLMAHGAWLGALSAGLAGPSSGRALPSRAAGGPNPASVDANGLSLGRAIAGVAAGQAIGFFSGLVLNSAGDMEPRTAGFSALGGIAGAAALGGLSLVLNLDSRPTYALADAGSIAGALTLGLLADRLEFHDNDVKLIALGAIGGTLAGGQFSVRVAEHTFNEQSFPGGLLLGFGAGTMGGLFLSQLVDVSDRQLYRSFLGAGLLGAAGTGFGYMVPGLDVRTRSNITGATIVLGLALTYPFSDQLRLSDAVLGYSALAATFGALWGSMAPAYWHAQSEALPADQVGGAVLFGTTLGAAGAIAVSQALRLDASTIGVATLGASSGTLMGAGLGLLVPSIDRRGTALLMQGTGLAGLAGLTLLTQGTEAGGLGGNAGDDTALAEHALLFAAYGTLAGSLIPALWHTDDAFLGQEVGGGAMLGLGAGSLIGVAALSLLDRPLDPPDLVESAVYTGAASSLGLGLGLVAGDRRFGASMTEGLLAAALGASITLSPHTRYVERDAWTFALGISALSWMGAFLPSTLSEDGPSSGKTWGGLLVGASAGVLLSALYVQLEPDRDDAEIATFAAASGGLGAGLGLMIPTLSDRGAVIMMESAMTLGLASGLVLSSSTHYTGGEIAMTFLASSAGGWHGAWTPSARTADGVSLREVGGGVLFGSSLGVLSGMALSQAFHPTMSDVGKIALLTVASNAAGGGLAASLGAQPHDEALAIQISGLGGLALFSALAPVIEYRGSDASLLTLMIAGGSTAGLFFSRAVDGAASGPRMLGGALMGAGAGALAGTLLSQIADVSADEQLESTGFTLAGAAIGGGLTLALPALTDRAGAIIIDSSILGFLTLGLALSPYTTYSDQDVFLLGFGAAAGFWNGLWLPMLLSDSSHAISGTETAGGAMLGAGVGVVAAGVLAQLVEVDREDQIKAGLPWILSSALGAGAGLLAPRFDRRGMVALMEGAGAAGLVFGLALSGIVQYSSADLGLVTVGALLGAGFGLTIPTVFGQDGAPAGPGARDADSLRAGGALLGAGVLGLSAATIAQFTEYGATDVVLIGGTSALAGMTGLGLGLMIPTSNRALQLGLMDAAGLVGAASALVFAPHVRLGQGDAATLLLTGAMGTSLGAIAPSLWSGTSFDKTPSELAGGGAMLGAGVGLGAGLLLSQVTELDSSHREYAALGAGIGALSGAGLGLLSSADDRLAVGLIEGLTMAGSIGLAATGPDVHFTAGDLALGGAYVGYLTWHTLGLTLLLQGTDRQAAGATMATIGLGTATGMYLAPYIHLNLAKVLMLFAGNVWGTWIGGWGGAILRDQLNRDIASRQSAGLTLISSVLGSDLGLSVTGLVVGGLLDVKPTRFAVINLSGLGGMMIGMLAAGFAKGEPLKAGNVIGSLSGLVAGSIVTSFVNFDSTPSWEELLADSGASRIAQERRGSDVGSPSRPSKDVIGVDSWFPSARVAQSPEGHEQYLFTVMGTWH